MKKITEEQLKKVQEHQKKLNEILNQIGFVEAQKHGLLHTFGEINKAVNEHKEELESIYGPVNINVETGEYEKISEEELKKIKETEATPTLEKVED